jgi:hypothetical protein
MGDFGPGLKGLELQGPAALRGESGSPPRVDRKPV